MVRILLLVFCPRENRLPFGSQFALRLILNNYGTKKKSKKGRKAPIARARTQAKRDSYVDTIGG
ncbi:hypothetical protein SAMN05660293_01527 [Dyadobacter psychrophilus]|uniref:Uncharacterized protein n=1 Tax=Dyadobacter psychrophilus TaxID=651661 RepID=A0A1T5DCL7_9BACT|nr:hypothetical protein SAMN05660293_01527 [Dyadobacter psychrophilus]